SSAYTMTSLTTPTQWLDKHLHRSCISPYTVRKTLQALHNNTAYAWQDSAAYSLDTQLPLSRVALASPPQQPCRLPLSSRPRQPYIFYNAPTVSSWMLRYSICSPHHLKQAESKLRRPRPFLPHLLTIKHVTSTYAKYPNPTT